MYFYFLSNNLIAIKSIALGVYVGLSTSDKSSVRACARIVLFYESQCWSLFNNENCKMSHLILFWNACMGSCFDFANMLTAMGSNVNNLGPLVVISIHVGEVRNLLISL